MSTEANHQSVNRPWIVLVASDQEWSARSIDSILGPHGYAVLRAYSGKQALDLASTTAPDAIILDTRTRDLSGFDVCRMLRQEGRVSALTPIILTAATSTSRTERLKAFAAGAWEFFPQPLDGEALIVQLSTFLAAKQEADRMRDENLLDALTGLYSMRGLARRAREIGAEAYRLRSPLACIAFAPVDFGRGELSVLSPEQSERIVGHVGTVFRETGRVSDAIGRFGQSEFGIVAPATDRIGVLKLVERLRSALDSTPLRLEYEPARIGVKVGYHAVANYAESPVDAVEMLLRASTALHASLSDGITDSVQAFEQLQTGLVS
jgi:diguanylate cyclase (GGDEF)-like protein